MAEPREERRVELDRSQFCCPICLDLLKEPVAIHCGHNYCHSCIEGCWDHGEAEEEEKKKKKGQYSCPQCRETFHPRPVLRRNNTLAEVVEKLKKTSAQQLSPPAAVPCAGPADVACDFCCGTGPNKATMSCLTCLASYCPAHLEPHSSVPVLKKHQLVSATVPLQQKMCTKHNKLLEVYCQTDKKFICYLCVIDEHKSHCTVSAAAERDEEQEQLIVSQKKIQEREKERKEELNELVQALKDFQSCSRAAVQTGDKIFDEMISSIKRKHTLAKQLIKAREKMAVAQAEELQLQLEEEIAKLRRRHTELEQLIRTNDHIHFIQTFQSLSTSCESPDLPPDLVVRPERWFKTVTDLVSKLRDDIERLMNDTWRTVSATVSTIDVVLPPVPKTREQFLRYCCPLTLNENSANNYLSISQESRRVTREDLALYCSAHSERFTNAMQVLCTEGLTERCYWEVSWSGSNLSVAVSYKDISRSYSRESEFGNNDKSWSFECFQFGYSFQHNRNSVTLLGPQSSRIGVYLDHKAGILSFYSVSDKMTLLHKVHATFSQPLYPGLKLIYGNSWAELIKLW